MSTVFDAKNKIALVSSLLPALRTGDATGVSVDTQDSVGVAVFAHIGLSGDTLSGSVKIEMELEESDDNSTWNDVADADLDAAVAGTNPGTFAVIDAAADDEQIYKVGYKGAKRYIRVVANFTGTHTNGCPLSAAVYLLPAHLPA